MIIYNTIRRRPRTRARQRERDLSISLVRSCLRRVSVTRKRVQSVATVAA